MRDSQFDDMQRLQCEEEYSKCFIWVVLMVLRCCWPHYNRVRKSFQAILAEQVCLCASTDQEHVAKFGQKSGPTISAFYPLTRQLLTTSAQPDLAYP